MIWKSTKKPLLDYAKILHSLSKDTNIANDRIKYQQRLAALVPIFIEVFGMGSENDLKELVTVELRRDGLDLFPKDESEAKKNADASQAFFDFFK